MERAAYTQALLAKKLRGVCVCGTALYGNAASRMAEHVPTTAPIWEYVWPSGVGPRVEEPALMLINPYPWSARLEEVRLKKK